MKKWIAGLLTVVLMISVCACSININMIGPTGSATEATGSVTEATAPPAEATAAQTAPDGYFYVEHPDGLWRVTVPEIWHDKGLFVTLEDGHTLYMKFVLKDAYYEGAGHVFTIATVSGSANFADVSYFPRADELYRDDEIQIYAEYPTDVQFGVYDDPSSDAFKQQQQDYQALAETKQGIIDSLTLRD